MTGEDVARVLAAEPVWASVPVARCLPVDDGRFLDGLTVGGLPRPVEVIATDGLALRAALGAPVAVPA